MRIATLLLLALLFAGCSKDEPTTTKKETTQNVASTKSHLINISSMEQFEQVITSEKLSLVDIYATWCGPCKMLAPILEELASDYSGKLQVVKVDGEKHRNIARKYKLDAYPTMVLVKNSETISKIVGFRPKPELIKLIDANL